MFGTQLHWSTFWFIVIQLILLCIFTLIFQTRKSESSFKRLIYLTLSYLFFNIASGLFPDEGLFLPLYWQYILSYFSGIQLGIVLLYYCCVEFDIQPFQRFSPRITAYFLIILFILFFAIPFGQTDDLYFSKKLFLLFPIILTIGYFIRMTRLIYSISKTRQGNKLFRPKLIATYFAFITICCLPFLAFMGDWQFIEQPLVNVGYLGLVAIHITGFIEQSRKEYDFFRTRSKVENDSKKEQEKPINVLTFFKEHKLTSQQMKVAALIIANPDKSFVELAQELNITSHTFSSHAAAVYRKLNLTIKSKEGLAIRVKGMDFSELNSNLSET